MNDIKDVKPPLNLFDFGLLLWALVAIAAVAAIFFLLSRKKSVFLKPQPVLLLKPAWDIAYEELEALRKLNLIERGLFKEFFTAVADIARKYMENRFNIRAPHMSTEEFLFYLGVSGHLNEPQKASLKDFLNSCDLVKFAKYAPTIKEANQNFDLAKRLVDDTRL